MRKVFSGFVKIVIRESGLILKDFDIITMILLAPLFYSLLYASFYVNKTETKVPVVVVDLDKSLLSNQFINSINQHQLIDVTERLENLNDIYDRLYSEKAEGAIIIPENFESLLKSGKGTEIKLYLNTQRFLPSNDINKAVNEVVIEYGKQMRLRAYNLNGVGLKQAEEIVEPIKDDVRFLFNPETTYGDFLIPAILVLILQQTLFMGLGESVAKENEQNSLNEWYNNANRSVSAAIAGKGVLYLIIFSCYSLFFFVMHFMIFKIKFIGSYFLLMIATIIFLISITGIAIFVASFFKRKVLALQVISFTSYPLFFLTGYTWPAFSMPRVLKWISDLIPGTPYFDIFTRISSMGADFSEIRPVFFHLVLLTIIILFAAAIRLNKIFKNSLIVK